MGSVSRWCICRVIVIATAIKVMLMIFCTMMKTLLNTILFLS